MGMYTELNIGIELEKTTPSNIIEVIEYMLSDKEREVPKLPHHPLFDTNRWKFMLTCSSYYFDAQPVHHFKKDNITGTYFLTNISNLKNYDFEIELFLDWIKPYVLTDGFTGFMRYEESKYPTLITHEKYERGMVLKSANGDEETLNVVEYIEYNAKNSRLSEADEEKWKKWLKEYNK